MAEFKCNVCDKVFTRKASLIYHTNNSVCWLKPIDNENDDDDNEINKPNEQMYECNFCARKFNTKTSMYRHTRYNCKIKKKDNNDKDDILARLILLEKDNKKLRKENEKMKGQIEKVMKTTDKSIINNNTTNINNGVVNNIVVLVKYETEDTSLIDKKDINRCGGYGYKAVEALTKTIHFNPKYPQFQNVYISNMKDPYAMIFDGSKWVLTTKKEVIDSLYENKKNIIEENLEDFIDSLPPSKKRALRTWLASDDDEGESKIAMKIKDGIKLLLYNERQIGINSKETYETRIKNSVLDSSVELIETKSEIPHINTNCTLKKNKSTTITNSSSEEDNSDDSISIEDVSVVSRISVKPVKAQKQIGIVKKATARKATAVKAPVK